MENYEKDVELRRMVNEALTLGSQGDKKLAVQTAKDVMVKFLHDPDFGKGDMDVTVALIDLLEAYNETKLVLEIVRRQCELRQTLCFKEGLRYFRSVYASNSKALLSDFDPDANPDEIGKSILIACIPKTGSTFLMNTLEKTTGFKALKLCLSYANEENILHPESVTYYQNIDKIAQEHIRATPQNLALAQGFDMSVIVLVRNIFDSLVSMRDMLMTNMIGSVASLFQQDMKNFSEEMRMDAVISKFAHWQLEFYASWIRAIREGRIDARVLTYESMMADKPGSIMDICSYANIDIAEESITAAINTVENTDGMSRKNIGISGRGLAAMTSEQIEVIKSMAKIYPDIDFSPLGLD